MRTSSSVVQIVIIVGGLMGVILKDYLAKEAFRCRDCGIVSDAPMLKDEIWLSIAKKKDYLCLDCIEKRLGRMITLDDLNSSLWSKVLIRLVERARAALTPEVEWQPIETAPKNATEVLLLVQRKGKGWPTTMRIVGHWASNLSGEEQPPFQGWFQDDGYGFREINPPPTHWAPLFPELPERVKK